MEHANVSRRRLSHYAQQREQSRQKDYDRRRDKNQAVGKQAAHWQPP